MFDKDKNINVLEITGEPISNGGQEAFIVNLLQHMPKSNMTFDVLTPYYCDNDRYNDIISRRGKLYCLGLPFSPKKGRFNLIRPVKKFLDEHKYDVVHIHSGSVSVLAECANIAKKAHIKTIIVHSHCAVERKTLKYRLARIFFDRAMRKAPTYYAACSVLAGEAKFPLKICKEKLMIFKNGVDIDKFRYNKAIRNEVREKLGIEEGSILIGHVGRFSYQKNHEYLLSILCQLINKNIKVKLLLIGSGENFEDIKARSKKLGIADNILFIGNVDNVNEYMQAMDVFTLPSRYEGLPIVGVEAQASGLPCIFSNQVTKEVALTPNVSFFPITENDITVWADSIEYYAGLSRRDTADKIKDAGYDINDVVKILFGIYCNLSQ